MEINITTTNKPGHFRIQKFEIPAGSDLSCFKLVVQAIQNFDGRTVVSVFEEDDNHRSCVRFGDTLFGKVGTRNLPEWLRNAENSYEKEAFEAEVDKEKDAEYSFAYQVISEVFGDVDGAEKRDGEIIFNAKDLASQLISELDEIHGGGYLLESLMVSDETGSDFELADFMVSLRGTSVALANASVSFRDEFLKGHITESGLLRELIEKTYN